MRRNDRKDIRKTPHGRLAEIIDTIAFGAKLRISLAWGQGAFGGAVTGCIRPVARPGPLLSRDWLCFWRPSPLCS